MDPAKNILMYFLIIIALGNICFEISTVFYNALLKKVSNTNNIGKISGIAWSLGYIGGVLSLIICFFLFVNPGETIFDLDKEKFEHIRIIGPFIGLWFLVFSIPSFIFIKEKKTKVKKNKFNKKYKKNFFINQKNNS